MAIDVIDNLSEKFNLLENDKRVESVFSRSEPVYMTSGGVPGEDFDMQNLILRVPGSKF